jgi:hypothetical protein
MEDDDTLTRHSFSGWRRRATLIRQRLIGNRRHESETLIDSHARSSTITTLPNRDERIKNINKMFPFHQKKGPRYIFIYLFSTWTSIVKVGQAVVLLSFNSIHLFGHAPFVLVLPFCNTNLSKSFALACATACVKEISSIAQPL